MNEEDKENEREIAQKFQSFTEEQPENIYKQKGVDPIKATSVANLKFNESQRRLLIEIYEAAKNTLSSATSPYKSIHDFYFDRIKDIQVSFVCATFLIIFNLAYKPYDR